MRKTTLALLAAVLLVGLAIPAQAAPGDAHITATIPTATTFTFTAATCALGTVNPGSSAQQLNCVTYTVATNNALGFSVKLNIPAKSAALQGLSSFMSVRRNGQTVWNPFSYSSIQGAGAEDTTSTGCSPLANGCWRHTIVANSTAYGDDYRIDVDAANPAGAVDQLVTYVATSN